MRCSAIESVIPGFHGRSGPLHRQLPVRCAADTAGLGDDPEFRPERQACCRYQFEPQSIRWEYGLPARLTRWKGQYRPATTIEYSIPKKSEVLRTIHDGLGREVARLVDGEQAAGRHSIVFDVTQLASGLYYYRLAAGTENDGGQVASNQIRLKPGLPLLFVSLHDTAERRFIR